jgi:hypothetical protein
MALASSQSSLCIVSQLAVGAWGVKGTFRFKDLRFRIEDVELLASDVEDNPLLSATGAGMWVILGTFTTATLYL